MKGIQHRSLAGIAGATVALVIAGCAGSSTKAVRTPAKGASAPNAKGRAAPVEPEVLTEQDGQRLWCGYLQQLYKRADQNAAAWPRYAECIQVKTTASPKLLKQTAECSQKALDAFVGDPFTAAYAAEVSRCGTSALEATVASKAEIEPFIADLCARAVACGQFDPAQCRASFSGSLEVSLQRAVGAMNRTGREEFHACLRTSTCEDLKGRVPACLEPIMDRLLWLPD